MKWYHKYLSAFERPHQEVPVEVKKEIANKMSRFRPQETPECSVVLIAHNEERHILGCLWSLVDNICDFPVEIIVVDNHSTDATGRLLDEVNAVWHYEDRKSPGFARQCGLDHARGVYHLCIDSDTLYPPHYISTHVEHLKRPGVACTYGLWSFMPDARHPQTSLFFYELFRDIYLCLENINRPELCVRGMVLGFRTEYGKKVGYRTHIIRGEDGMMALGLKKYGRLKLLKTRKARALTSNATLDGAGSLRANVWLRIKRAIRNFHLLFTTQQEYKDQEYNLIKNKEEE